MLVAAWIVLLGVQWHVFAQVTLVLLSSVSNFHQIRWTCCFTQRRSMRTILSFNICKQVQQPWRKSTRAQSIPIPGNLESVSNLEPENCFVIFSLYSICWRLLATRYAVLQESQPACSAVLSCSENSEEVDVLVSRLKSLISDVKSAQHLKSSCGASSVSAGCSWRIPMEIKIQIWLVLL